MKKLLLILLSISILLINCKEEDELEYINPPPSIYTYVPDDNFEIALINLGVDNTLNDTVLTAAIDTIKELNLYNRYISDLSGIENFAALTYLNCSENQLTSLDISKNTALSSLSCFGNQLSNINVNGATALSSLNCYNNQLLSLNVNGATALSSLNCDFNQLTNINVSGATNLINLSCRGNQLTNLNISGATALTGLDCSENQLISLDLRNGNNTNLSLVANFNPNLYCIDVDNENWSIFLSNWIIPPQSFFSEDCGVK